MNMGGRVRRKERKSDKLLKNTEDVGSGYCKFLVAVLFSTLLAFILIGCGASASTGEAEIAHSGPAMACRHEVQLQGDKAMMDGEEIALTNGALVICETGEYVLSGSFPEGKILIAVSGEDSEVLLVFNGVSLSCSDGSALEALQADKLTIYLAEGTDNRLHSGAAKRPAPDKEATGAALRTEGSLTLEGTGNLSVEGFINNGIACKKDLLILEGNLNIAAANSGIRANRSLEVLGGTMNIVAGNDALCTRSDKLQGDMTIAGGTLTAHAGGDGITSSGKILITGGKMNITTDGDPEILSSKGIRAEKDIRITGGEINVSSTDHALRGGEGLSVSGGNLFLCSSQGKGIAAKGAVRIEGDPIIMAEAAGNGLETETDLLIAGGILTTHAGGDGLRAGDSGTGKGTLIISGGEVCVSAGSDALDAKIQMNILGGRLFAAGNSYRLRPFFGEDTQPFLSVKLETAATGWLRIRSNGGEMDSMETATPVDTLYYSAPKLIRGETYELLTGDETVTLTAK